MSAEALRPDTGPAHLLGRLVGALGVPFGYERSFRVCAGAVLRRRFLVSLSKVSLGPDAHARVLALCRRLDMPEQLQDAAAADLAAARFVHFGYEEDRSSRLCKVYLERGLAPGSAVPAAPVLLHRAYKWDPAAPSRFARTEYHWHPGLTTAAMLDRMAAIYRGGHADPSFALARDVLRAGEARLTRGSIRYLEVSEAENPRRSFDVNLYDAGLLMRDLVPVLARMVPHFALPAGALEGLVAAHASKVVGHWAGGAHRGGEDFFNVYFGVEERRGPFEDVEP